MGVLLVMMLIRKANKSGVKSAKIQELCEKDTFIDKLNQLLYNN